MMIGCDFKNMNSMLSSKSDENQIFRQSCDCKPSILVVDDIYYNRKVIIDILKEFWKIEADQASDGDIAVEMFKNALEKPC